MVDSSSKNPVRYRLESRQSGIEVTLYVLVVYSHSIVEHGMKNLLGNLMRAADLLARRLGRIWVAGISQRIILT